MAKVGINYKGLHKRDTYEGLIDYLENKQEKIKFPNREAKFVRDSPQYQSLLNEGFVEVEEQQLKQVKEEQKEHAVIQTANDTNETAKEVKVVASQTDKPLIVKTKSTQSQASPQIFDMTLNDHMSNFKQDVESVENTQQQNKQQQAQHINRILQNHLQNEATPDTENFAHKIASSAASAAVSSLQKFGQGLRHLSSSTNPPNKPYSTSMLLGDDLPPNFFGEMNPPQLPAGVKLPHQKQSRPKDKKIFDIDDAIEKSKPKAKAKTGPLKVKTLDDEYDELMADVENKPKHKPGAKSKPKNKDKDKDKDVPPVIKTPKLKTKNASGLTTGVQIPPSKIGIQKLREELENAKNKNKLTAQDTSDYMKLYDDWKGAKGDKAKKDEKLKGLREIYKRVLYKKG